MHMAGEHGGEWTDFTRVLMAARGELGKGQMLHADSFNLGDSMSALEMMDPKMDAGLVNPDVVSAEESFEQGLVPLHPDLETMVALSDKMLALEMTWVRGTGFFPRPRSVFTCLYCHRPDEIQNQSLRLYCQALLKSCELVKKAVSRANVYEEEDFSMNLGGFSFYDKLSEEPLTSLGDSSLTGLEENLQKHLKLVKMSAGGKGEGGESREVPSEGQETRQQAGAPTEGFILDVQDAPVLEAFLARIRLRRAWLGVLHNLSKGFKSLKSAHKLIAYALAQLSVTRATVNYDSSRVGKFAIQPRLNMKLMAPSPPRPVPILNLSAAFDELEEQLNFLKTLCVKLPFVTSLSQLHHFLEDYTSGSPAPGALPRSFLRLLLTSGNFLGGENTQHLVRQSMADYLIPEHALQSVSAASFIHTTSKLVLNYCTSSCYNLGRQRRRMARSIDDWAHAQLEAELVDQTVFLVYEDRKPCLLSETGAFFSGWLLDQMLVMVVRYFELGFQLRLYAGFEHSMLYWYMDYLLGVRINCQPSIFFPKSRQHQLEESRGVAEKGGKGASKKKDKSKGHGGKTGGAKKSEPSMEQLMLEAKQAMCRGVFRLIAGLNSEKIYELDELSRATLPLRFQRRFGPVMRVEQPHALSFLHYEENTDSSQYHPSELYGAAAESFFQARTVADKLVHKLQASSSEDAGVLLDEMAKTAKGLVAVATFNESLAEFTYQRSIAGQQQGGRGAGSDDFPLPPGYKMAQEYTEWTRRKSRKEEDAAESRSRGGEERPDEWQDEWKPWMNAMEHNLLCDAPQMKVTKKVSFIFGPSQIYPFVMIDMKR
ncbi:hypothetical protein GUITHDRAFT_145852 [Guillardia theta CCMP2712]|uniref:Uncharacterized protein n=2 Tax=Guillardia theta TaxID=55529 RepID=L1IK54_GUITC|nr:hypothetical protein GUITHDRAFT_145852 [Guillardia theta CCMP2712]EKX36279.1 hypothetical protein GUITHDRAFT_145852 [Guillardia theta CCMP2712]|eukprot:XP_005823259.1 hypothetical protein GUITHDRAFT_145852 [Guillardia theta CCMP2712]